MDALRAPVRLPRCPDKKAVACGDQPLHDAAYCAPLMRMQ